MHEEQARVFFDPADYYRTLPDILDLDEKDLDFMLARELFMGEYELSVTQEQSEFSMREIEARLFGKTENGYIGSRTFSPGFLCGHFSRQGLRSPTKPLVV